MEWVESLNHWAWMGLGLLLLAAEAFVSGFVIIWLGLAAIAVGIAKYAYPILSGELSLLLFGMCSLVSVFFWHKVFQKHHGQHRPDRLNTRSLSVVGRVAPLVGPIEFGRGKVNIDDTLWRVSGADAPSGTMVRVTEARGNILDVELVD